MTTAVYKYAVEVSDTFNVDMPAGAEILCVQVLDGRPYLWARVVIDPGHPNKVRRFRLAGTGEPLEGRIPEGRDGDYVGTFQIRGVVRLMPGPGPIEANSINVGKIQLSETSIVFHLFDCGET